jgi:2-polyprenyl-6-methoxyphenol hydroxylase-like FAD-dependent oxidoreductase
VQIARDEPLHADLIVDASGRHSKTPGLLADAGFGKLEESAVPVDVGYATALLELPPVPRPWKTLLVHPKYPHTRLGVLLPVEGTNRWLATLVGWRGDHPSDDYEQFLAFARSLAVPDFFSAIQPGKLIGRVFRYRFTGNVRRHYESLSPAPEGLVVIGDAASSFNPIYAQGMSQGAAGAALLNRSLERYPAGLAGFARVFQKRYARFMSQCWLMSTTEEFRDHNAFANAPRWTRAANWYLDRVHECTWHDPAVARRFLEVMHLQRHPVALASPGMMRRVLWRPHSAEPTQETAHVAE